MSATETAAEPQRLHRGVLGLADIAASTMANIGPAMSFFFGFGLIAEAARKRTAGGPQAGQRGGWAGTHRGAAEVFWEVVPELANDCGIALAQPGHVQIVVHKPTPIFVVGCRHFDEAVALARQLVRIEPFDGGPGVV